MVCEIHITVAEGVDEPAFVKWCEENKVKPIKAVSEKGDYKNQLMTSKYVNGTVAECIEQMHKISDQIKAAGFEVKRDKLEICCSTAESLKDFNVAQDGLYFESHFKVKKDDEHKLTEMLDKHPATGASVNVLSKNSKMPLVTVRLPCDKYCWKDLKQQTDDLVAELLEVGITVEEKKHLELAVYDNFREMDRNWLVYV
jgi:hypothetical protein